MGNRMIKSFRKAAFVLIGKVEKRYECDRPNYKKAITSFKKSATKVASGNDATLQKALFSFAKEIVQQVRKGKKKKKYENSSTSYSKIQKNYKK